MPADLRQQIAKALAAFADPALPLPATARAFFTTLGYRSTRRVIACFDNEQITEKNAGVTRASSW